MKDYKKILEGMVNIISTTEKSDIVFDNLCAYIGKNCPELKDKESEDERMWKLIKKYAHSNISDMALNADYITRKQLESWLEKQSDKKQDPCEHCDNVMLNCQNFPCIKKRAFEQGKSVFDVINEETVDNANKVEPEFKIGDWVVSPNGVYWHIDAIRNGRYQVSSNSGISTDWPLDTKNYHRFTIQDAKDGDVLAENKGDVILMFRRIGNTEWDDVIDYHCYYDCYRKDFIVQEDVKFWGNTENSQLKPATKEQRDTLEKAMTNAGFTFDFEKKELKKIEQNPAWSEEDERIYKGLHNLIYSTSYCDSRKEFSEWLKSIKDRVGCEVNCTTKKEWSEDDEKMRLDLLQYFVDGNDLKHNLAYIFDWLKSLKDRIQPQNTWKPSEEQMNALDSTLQYSQVSHNSFEHLNSLYNELEKLKG